MPAPDPEIEALRREVEQLKAQEIEGRQVAELQQQLMGVVGHDLRNPLFAIMMGSHGILRTPGLPESARRNAARILGSAERMNAIIRDLVDLTLARSSGLSIAPREADVSSCCRRALDVLEAANPGRAISFTCEGNGWGLWDPQRLEQVIDNLVGNALEHGSPSSPVQLACRETEAEVVVTVHNQGEPIALELLPHLFEPFRRGAHGDPTREHMGLGLYIAAKLVQAHGGTLDVISTREEGTTFTVRLPRRHPQP